MPLHVFGDGVAFFDGGEAALWGEGDVVADDGFCFSEAGFEVVHAFEHRIFRGDEPGNEAFVVVLHAGPWCEGAGAFVVVFDEINIVRDLHDNRRDGIVESGEERFALKIALAEMGGNGHVGRMIFQRFCRNSAEPFEHLRLGVAEGVNFLQEIVVNEIGPGSVVDLQIAAAVVVEILDRILVCFADVVDQRVEVVAIVWRFLVAKLQHMVNEDHVWTGDAFFRHDTVVFLRQPMEIIPGVHFLVGFIFVVEKFPCHLAVFHLVHAAGQRLGDVDRLESVELFQPVQMPPSAAEFAIGDKLQAVGHFFFYQLSDRFVFDRRQFFAGDRARFERCARFLHRIRTQERANDINFEINHYRSLLRIHWYYYTGSCMKMVWDYGVKERFDRFYIVDDA